MGLLNEAHHAIERTFNIQDTEESLSPKSNGGRDMRTNDPTISPAAIAPAYSDLQLPIPTLRDLPAWPSHIANSTRCLGEGWTPSPRIVVKIWGCGKWLSPRLRAAARDLRDSRRGKMLTTRPAPKRTGRESLLLVDSASESELGPRYDAASSARLKPKVRDVGTFFLSLSHYKRAAGLGWVP